MPVISCMNKFVSKNSLKRSVIKQKLILIILMSIFWMTLLNIHYFENKSVYVILMLFQEVKILIFIVQLPVVRYMTNGNIQTDKQSQHWNFQTDSLFTMKINI